MLPDPEPSARAWALGRSACTPRPSRKYPHRYRSSESTPSWHPAAETERSSGQSLSYRAMVPSARSRVHEGAETMTSMLVRADTLLDGTGGPAIRGGAAVLIADGTIQAVGPRDTVAAPSDAEIVELEHASILPGIVDGHVHLMLGAPN